jgi:Fe-S-cluster-containing dehydrogenase component
VVNAYLNDDKTGDTAFVKVQCMHCLEPACVSACIVGALEKTAAGPVVYDTDKCIGCRYCMVACPFEIPAYQYNEPLTPKIKKCTLCTPHNNTKENSSTPACTASCPAEALLYGTRKELLKVARARINANPERYINHIYGEYEAGGTSWLFLAADSFKEMDLPDLPAESPSHLTESVQHGLFKYGAVPAAAYGAMAALMWFKNRTPSQKKNSQKKDETND